MKRDVLVGAPMTQDVNNQLVMDLAKYSVAELNARENSQNKHILEEVLTASTQVG